MNERAIEQSCRECGRPLSFHDGRHAVRCESCFTSFLAIRDRDFLSSYAELGVRSRRIIAETALRAIATESPPHRKVLAMHIMEQYVQAAGDLIGLWLALKQRGKTPVMRAFLEFELDRNAALAFFQEVATTPGPELLQAIGVPTPEQASVRYPGLAKRDMKDFKRVVMQLLYDLEYTVQPGESAALALAQMAAEGRAGAALVNQSAWLDSVGLKAHQVASMAIDAKRRTINITAIPVDEKRLQQVLTQINAMTRASENLVYAVLTVYQEEERRAALEARVRS